MRKASALGINLVVITTLALIILIITLLLVAGSFRQVDTATSECASGLGFCTENCLAPSTISGTCPEEQLCCPYVRSPRVSVEWIPVGGEQ